MTNSSEKQIRSPQEIGDLRADVRSDETEGAENADCGDESGHASASIAGRAEDLSS